MKKMISLMMAAALAMGATSVPAFAYTNEAETEAVSVAVEEAETEETTAAAEDNAQYSVEENEDGSVTITFGDLEYTLGDEDDDTQLGQVVNVNSYLHLRTGAGMDYEIIGHLLNGTQVEVLDKDGDWYKVVVPEQSGYVHSSYLKLLDSTASGDSEDIDEDLLTLILYMMTATANADMTEATTASASDGLTPDGNLTLVDDIGSSTGAGQQFITLTTKAGNVFYLIIDRDDDGDENVHFLNLVDEADLLSLMDEEEAALYQSPVSTTTEEEPTPTVTEETPEETMDEEETTTEKKSSNMLPLLLLFLIGIGGVGGYLYLKVYKKKPTEKQDAPDPDADYTDEYEEAYNLPDDEDVDDEEEYEDYSADDDEEA